VKNALYTGSFDPLTRGHIDLIERAAAIFNKVYVGVGINQAKKYLFSQDERIAFVKLAFKDAPNVEVISIPENRLSADIAYELNAAVIKGVRMNADFDYERMLHDISHAHQHGLDTLILPSQPNLGHISSSAAKEICKLNGNTEDFVPLYVKQKMESRLVNQIRIGITGSIGAGKSTITRELVKLCQYHDHKVHDIDIDAIAADMIYDRQEPVYVELREKIKKLLNITSLRGNIGPVIFNDQAKLNEYNALVRQPLITRVRAAIQGKVGVLIFNFALLTEGNMLSMVNNQIALLDVRPEEQTKRLAARGYDADQIRRRVQMQFSYMDKLAAIYDAQRLHKFGHVFPVNTSDFTPERCAQAIYSSFIAE
jgi:pantetheine-phosphate adenylyltransferase